MKLKQAAEAISGQASEVDYIGMPPYVSLNQNQLKQVTQKHKLKKKVQTTKLLNSLIFGNGRALSLDDTTGFVKLITLKEDDTVIGAQIAGNGASDIISELGLAIEGWYESLKISH